MRSIEHARTRASGSRRRTPCSGSAQSDRRMEKTSPGLTAVADTLPSHMAYGRRAASAPPSADRGSNILEEQEQQPAPVCQRSSQRHAIQSTHQVPMDTIGTLMDRDSIQRKFKNKRPRRRTPRRDTAASSATDQPRPGLPRDPVFHDSGVPRLVSTRTPFHRPRRVPCASATTVSPGLARRRRPALRVGTDGGASAGRSPDRADAHRRRRVASDRVGRSCTDGRARPGRRGSTHPRAGVYRAASGRASVVRHRPRRQLCAPSRVVSIPPRSVATGVLWRRARAATSS